MAFADDYRARTFAFAKQCVLFCRDLGREWDARELARQLLRSGTGVCSNFRAACRGRSRREFIARLGVAVEEADESVMWLELLDETGIADRQRLRPVLSEARGLLSVLSRSLATAKDNSGRFE